MNILVFTLGEVSYFCGFTITLLYSKRYRIGFNGLIRAGSCIKISKLDRRNLVLSLISWNYKEII